jgi:hypothetical protein
MYIYVEIERVHSFLKEISWDFFIAYFSLCGPVLFDSSFSKDFARLVPVQGLF